ncbi:two-component system sensor histidine kinase NtrB [Desulfogranum japonicum]|uniref:two-component system sensor histidine kinase NtrB n=1 Tax=Desulfogranum japonicum TaxID=231447 RepID=UPI0003F4FF2F|nr:ATP-binding protein [Desulfogranum japonicum]
MNSAYAWKDLFSPVLDTEQQLKRHLLSLLLVRILLYATLLIITTLLHVKGHDGILPPHGIIITFMLVLTGYSAASAVYLRRPGISLRKFGVIQLLSDTLFAALLVYGTGCSQSIFTPVFILPVIAGGLILYKIGGLIPAASATILYGGILYMDYAAIIPEYLLTTPYKPMFNPLTGSNLFAIHGITFFVAALVSGQIAGRLRTTEKELSKTTLEYDRLSLLYKQIFDDISTGIITTNEQEHITSFNNAAENITGYSKGQVLGQLFTTIFPDILLDKPQTRKVCDLRRGDDHSSIRAGYSFSYLHMPSADSGETPPNMWKIVTIADISQVEKMEKQIREAEKMAAIGELSASIAHDFRNPLAAISGSAQILAGTQGDGEITDPETVRTLMAIILRESNRMARTITDFLQFARPTALHREWFDVERMAAEVLQQSELGKIGLDSQTILQDIETNLHCWADLQQVQTALKHLLENARAMAEDLQAVIAIKASERQIQGHAFVCIEVCDTGPGIQEELRDRIFEPFFTTRENGSGLGLAIVKQIVDNHHGTIELTHNAVYSCIVRICLPTPCPKENLSSR